MCGGLQLIKTLSTRSSRVLHASKHFLAPLHPWEFPGAPWEILLADFAGSFLDKMFLVVINAYSSHQMHYCTSWWYIIAIVFLQP